ALLQPRRPRRVRRDDRHDRPPPLQVPPRCRAGRSARAPGERGGDAAARRGPRCVRGEAGPRRPRGRGRRARAPRRHAPAAGRAVLRRLARRLRGRRPRLHGADRQPARHRVDASRAPRGGRRLREGVRQPRDGRRGRAAPGGATMNRPLALFAVAAVTRLTFAAEPPVELPQAPIRLDAGQQQAIGLTWGTAERRPVERVIRTVGRLDFDERKLAQVTLKVGGFIEELFANYTGQPVRRGDPLFTLYSPDLLTAQREYLLARETERRLSPGCRLCSTPSRERLRTASSCPPGPTISCAPRWTAPSSCACRSASAWSCRGPPCSTRAGARWCSSMEATGGSCPARCAW